MAIKDRLEKELKLAQESAEKIKEMAEEIKSTPTDKFEELKESVDKKVKEINESLDGSESKETFIDRLKAALIYFTEGDVYEGHEIADKIIELMDELRNQTLDIPDKDIFKFTDDSNKFD